MFEIPGKPCVENALNGYNTVKGLLITLAPGRSLFSLSLSLAITPRAYQLQSQVLCCSNLHQKKDVKGVALALDKQWTTLVYSEQSKRQTHLFHNLRDCAVTLGSSDILEVRLVEQMLLDSSHTRLIFAHDVPTDLAMSIRLHTNSDTTSQEICVSKVDLAYLVQRLKRYSSVRNFQVDLCDHVQRRGKGT